MALLGVLAVDPSGSTAAFSGRGGLWDNGAVDRNEVEAAIRARRDADDAHGAATAAIRSYGPQILAYLRAVLRDEDAAAEAFSRFAEGLWKGIARFRGDASALTWAYRIAWGAVREVRRDPYRRRARRLDTSAASRLAAEIRESTASHLGTSDLDRVSRLRASLEPDEQTLLILRLDRELPWREVALIFEVEESTLRKRYERLKARIRKLAREEGLLAAR